MAVEVVTKSIGSAGGRDYATIAAWLAACPANLTTGGADGQGIIWRGELYNDGEITLPAALSAPAVTTSATQYLELTAAAGHSFIDNLGYYDTHALRYDPAAGASIRMGFNGTSGGATLLTANAFMKINRLQLIMGSIDNNYPIFSFVGGKVTVQQSILESLSTQPVVVCTGSTAKMELENTLIIKRRGGACAQVSNGGTAASYKHCTFFAPTGGTNCIVQNYNYGPVIQSCVAVGFNNLYYSANSVAANASCGGNASTSATGNPGVAAGKSSLVAADIFKNVSAPADNSSTPLYDLMPKAGSVANTSGIPVSGVALDLLGKTRNAVTPTSGAVEYIAVGTIGSITATLDAIVGAFTASGSVLSLAAINALLSDFTGGFTALGFAGSTTASIGGTLSNVTGAISATGSAGVSGSLTIPALKNNAGTVWASVSGITVVVVKSSDLSVVATKTGLSTDASGNLVVADGAIIAGTEYIALIVTSAKAHGSAKLTAA